MLLTDNRKCPIEDRLTIGKTGWFSNRNSHWTKKANHRCQAVPWPTGKSRFDLVSETRRTGEHVAPGIINRAIFYTEHDHVFSQVQMVYWIECVWPWQPSWSRVKMNSKTKSALFKTSMYLLTFIGFQSIFGRSKTTSALLKTRYLFLSPFIGFVVEPPPSHSEETLFMYGKILTPRTYPIGPDLYPL